MARIKIEDLPVNEEMNEQELKGVFGGFNPQPEPPLRSFGFQRVRRGIGLRGQLVGSVPPNGAVPPRAVPPNGARVGKRLF